MTFAISLRQKWELMFVFQIPACLFIVEESANGLLKYGPCISNIKMCLHMKFEKNITFACPLPNFFCDCNIYLCREDTKFLCLWEALLTETENYVLDL